MPMPHELQSRWTPRALGALGLGCLLLAGCASVPQLGPKPVPLGPPQIAAEHSLAPSATAAATSTTRTA
jgi:hypothetical protein